MAEKLDPQQVVTFEELLRAIMIEQDATRRVLVRKGLLTNEEVLEELKAVRGRWRGGEERNGWDFGTVLATPSEPWDASLGEMRERILVEISCHERCTCWRYWD